MSARSRILGALLVLAQALTFMFFVAAPAGAAVSGPLVAAHSSLCVTIEAGSTASGATAVQDVCDGDTDQAIELRDAGSNTVELVMAHSGLCLRPSGDSAAAGAEIVQGACDGAATARWTTAAVTGGLRLQVASTGLCLDVFGGQTTTGTALIQWSCHGGPNQVFDYQGVEAEDCSTAAVIEAEDGDLSGAMAVAADGSASGGQYIHVPEGTGNAWDIGSPNQATYCFDVGQSGSYRIETRSRGIDGTSDSFHVTVDGEPLSGFLWDIGIAADYIVGNVSDRNGDDPVVVSLDAGEHIITFHHREDGSRLDTVALVPVDSGGGGGGGACTTESTQEAEDGALSGAMSVAADGAASGGQYVHVPEGNGNAWTIGGVSQAAFCFDLSAAGTYRIETRSQGLDNLSDSMYVTVDGQPATGFLWDIGVSTTFVTSSVSDRNGADPVQVQLDAGEHTITFHHREAGSRLDTVGLVRIDGGGGGGGGGACTTASSQEAEDGALSGSMASAGGATASGGQYVHVPEGTGNAWDIGSPNQATYCFTIGQSGTYKIETLAQGLDGLSDSFHVTVNDQPVSGFLWDIGVASTFATSDVSDRGGADPVEIALDPGDHTITFHHREDGSRLDRVSLIPTGDDPDPGNTSGVWGPVTDVGLVPVAMANVSSGEVLMWSAYGRFTFGGSRGYTQTAMYDPTSGAVRARQVSNTGHDMFCPGIANLPDGRVLVSGGSGAAETSIYNPATDAWEDAADMNVGRGYQGNVTLGDGSVLTVGGSWSGGVAEKASEIYRNGTWTTLPGIVGRGSLETADAQGQYRSDNHMWLFAWSGDQVLHAGPSRTMNWLNVSGQGSVQSAGDRESDDAMNGNAVMYDVGRILTVGGAPNYNDSPGTAKAHVIDINSGANSRRIQDLSIPRTLHNSVVLPSGEVLVTGGQAVSVLFTDQAAVLTPELFDPETETWSSMAPMAVPRTYHSAALLLMDGRVMVGGGGLCGTCATNHPDVQIFTPPYLLYSNGQERPRPTITAAPGSAGYGQTMTVGVSGGADEFVLIRMANSTHSVNNAQRRVPLSFSDSGGGQYRVTIPSERGHAPPGAYMLFALDGNGVPSVATVVNIG